MGRRQQTVATFAVSIKVPKGATIQNTQEYIKDAIYTHGGAFSPEHPFFDRAGLNLNVALTKKVTTYGNN